MKIKLVKRHAMLIPLIISIAMVIALIQCIYSPLPSLTPSQISASEAWNIQAAKENPIPGNNCFKALTRK